MRHVFLLVIWSAILLSCGGDDDSSLLEPIDLLPADGEISGWSWDGIPAEATDQSSLYNLIDGGAEEFVAQGFVSGVLHSYRGLLGGAVATVELFIADQGTPSNAKAIFDRRSDRLPFAQDITIGDADEARIDETVTFDSVVLDLWQDRFYVQASVSGRDAAPDLARQTVIQFADNVSRGIREGTP